MKKVGLENAHLTSITTLSGATFCPPSPNSLNSFSLGQDSTHTPPFSSFTFSSTSSLTFLSHFSFHSCFLSILPLFINSLLTLLFRCHFLSPMFNPSLQSPLAFFVPFFPFTFLSNPNYFSLWPCFIMSFSSCLSTLSPISLPHTFSNQTAS